MFDEFIAAISQAEKLAFPDVQAFRGVTTVAPMDVGDSQYGSRRFCIALLIAATLAFVWVRAPLLSVPLERDEGEYAYIAQRMLVGDVPYVDAFDQKPPAIFVAYLVAFTIFDQSTESIHLFLYLWTALTALALHQLVRRLAGPVAAAFTTAIFAVTSGSTVLTGNAANTEIFMLLPMVASVACMLRALDAPTAWVWWALCGALAALACWFKQVAAFNVLFVAAVPAAMALRRRGPGEVAWLVRVYIALGIGGFAVTGTASALLIASGAWEAFVDAAILHNFDYSQGMSIADGARSLQRRMSEQVNGFGMYWALALAGLLLPGFLTTRARIFLCGWLLLSAAGVSVGFYFRPHYFFQLLPALSALAGCMLAGISDRVLRSGGAFAGAASGVVLAVIALAGPIIADAPVRGAGSPEAISRSIYGVNPFVESAEIGKYIRRTSAPGDTIYIIGSEPQIFFYADRASATRYIFIYPLTGNYPGVLDRQREVAATVTEARPRYIVWSNIATSWLVEAGSEPFLFAHAQAMIERDYRLEFVAHPVSSDAQFEFVYGSRARRLMQRAGKGAEDAQWIALYRRRADRD